MGQDITFATLIGSRICHDLISPIGAINNGIELIEMSVPSMGPEMSLITESVTNASARIRFFRIAFGAAGVQLIGRPEVISILKDVYSGARLSVAWGPLEAQQRRKIRLTFLSLMCMETGMPFGGRIEVAEQDDRLVITGYADKFKIDPDLWGAFDGQKEAHDLRPAHVQFGLLPVIATDEDVALDVSITEERIRISL
jgi:histidine phosphotransferase ChpT